jgi:hypothetical protein
LQRTETLDFVQGGSVGGDLCAPERTTAIPAKMTIELGSLLTRREQGGA